MCKCDYTRTVWKDAKDLDGEITRVEVEEHVSFCQDIDTHRFKCTNCGEIGYYSGRAKDHFEGRKKDPFIAKSNKPAKK